MNTRHRIPTLFSLSMVDVLCCALGCVILLWLVNSRDARKKSVAAGKTETKLKTTIEDLNKTKYELDYTTDEYNITVSQLEQSKNKVVRLENELADLLKKNKAILAKLLLKESDYKKASEQLTLTAEELATVKLLLARKKKELANEKIEVTNLSNKLVASNKKVTSLTDLLGSSDTRVQKLSGMLDDSSKQLDKMSGQLSSTEKKVEKLTAQLNVSDKLIKQLQQLLGKLKLESKDYSTKLAKNELQTESLSKELESKTKALEQKELKVEDLLKQLAVLTENTKALELQMASGNIDLTKAKLTIADLKKDKAGLLQKATMFQSALKNRFAGIELTGKKILFLLDVSGSMKRFDRNTDAPGKWKTVCNILGKIMRSLPDVSHYQVIAFSDTVSYPLGYSGRWLIYDPKTSPEYLVEKLSEINPDGGTNMEPAFAEAFKYKIGGLDTIYLVSDGLPDPLKVPEQIKDLSQVARTSYLCNQIRQKLKNEWNPRINQQTPVRINTIGFFFESPDVGAFLWALARENDGNFVGMSKP